MQLFNLEFFTHWIGQNPDWALSIVFFIAFIESLAVVGLLMPGWLLLVAVGVLIGTGNISFYWASLSCFAGAAIGEYLSYLVGVRYRQQVRHWSIFKRHPDWLGNTDKFFEQYGIASIVLGRFVGPVRAFVPLIAGMSSMPLIKFQLTNLISAAVWAPLYLMPGVLLGAAVQIEDTARWSILSTLLLIILSAWYFIRSISIESQVRIYKMMVSVSVFFTALWILFYGWYAKDFVELMIKFWSIINSGQL